ncbi:MAG: hypothetical protein ACLR1J_09140, partial [Anaerovoracaceae bacterium]
LEMYNIDKIRHRKPSGIASTFLKMLSFFLHQGFLPTLKNQTEQFSFNLTLASSSQPNCISMSASSRRSRYNPLRTLHHKSNMPTVAQLTFSTHELSQKLYFVEKNSLQSR